MTTSQSPTRKESQEIDRLTQVVGSLEHQVRTLGLILDEIREELVGSVRNDQRGSRQRTSLSSNSFEEEALARENRASSQPVVKATKSPASFSPQRVLPSTSVRSTDVSHKLSLKEHMFEDHLYIEIVRIIGYEGIALTDFQQKCKQLLDTYGHAAAQEAGKALTRIDAAREPPMLYLNDKARPWAWPTLGPDPKNRPWWATSEQPSEHGPIKAKKPSRQMSKQKNQDR